MLTDFENKLDDLKASDLREAIKSVIAIINEWSKRSERGFHTPVNTLYRLKNVVFVPLLLVYEAPGVSLDLDTRIGQLTNGLRELAIHWGNFAISQEQSPSCDYQSMIENVKLGVDELITQFSSHNRFVRTITNNNPQYLNDGKARHPLSMNIQQLPHAPASYDSVSRSDSPICLQGTQEAVLGAISMWFYDNSHSILLLKGGPGTGKSTIAQTVATHAADHHRLAASFFFSQDETTRKSSRLLFPSIAFQLAQANEGFEARISAALQRSPNAMRRSLSIQLRQLITGPLKDIDEIGEPLLIIVDALDECEEKGAIEILQLLLNEAPRFPSHFKFLVTFRPESHFQAVLDTLNDRKRTIQFQIENTSTRDDIQLVLEHHLSQTEIQKALPGCEWKLNKQHLEVLTKEANQTFLVASTMIKFITDPTIRDPQSRLETVLRNSKGKGKYTHPELTTLAHLYSEILSAAVPTGDSATIPAELLRKVVGTISILEDPLLLHPLCSLLDIPVDSVEPMLSRLQPIIISSSEDPRLRIHHPLFASFLTDPQLMGRDERFVIDSAKRHEQIVESCFDLMARKLKKNICDTPFPDCYLENFMIPGLRARIEEHIPQELVYACCQWLIHLRKSPPDSGRLMGRLELFAFEHLLFWLEVLSLTGNLPVSLALDHAEHYATSHGASQKLITILKDVQRFLKEFHKTISVSALHVYFSALPFVPNQTELHLAYGVKAEKSVQLLRGRDRNWDQPVLQGHYRTVRSVAFSADGRRLVSASDDKTFKIWDAATGTHIMTIAVSDAVNSVEFSPDCAHLASGADSGKVELWDAVTGSQLASFEGHTGLIWSVRFSPDGTCIASGSGDRTIRQWEVVTGTQRATMEGHTGEINSVSFSPDSIKLASASDDHTVRLWNAATGAQIAVLEGHSNTIWSVAFSPDGTRVASGSNDSTIRVWDAIGAAHILTLSGHSSVVYSVLFCAGGTHIVSGSGDRTIKLWNAEGEGVVSTLEGHSNAVRCVAVSSDGTQFASASTDHTVRLWDSALSTRLGEADSMVFSPGGTWLATTSFDSILQVWEASDIAPLPAFCRRSELLQAAFCTDDTCIISAPDKKSIQLYDLTSGNRLATLEGHSGAIVIVVLSLDGMKLASASFDNTIRLWDVTTRAHMAVLEGHSSRVLFVTFSPNSARLAFGSEDNTVRLWDVVAGRHIAILQGHSGPVWKGAFSCCKTKFVSGSDDGTVRLWDAVTGNHIFTLEGHSGAILDVVFSPDRKGGLVASASQDKTIRLWDAASGTCLSVLEGHSSRVWEVVFSPDGLRLASASDDLTLRMWDTATSAQVHALDRHFSLPDVSNVFTGPGLHVVERRGCPVLVRLYSRSDGSIVEIPIFWLPAGLKPTRSRCSTSRVAIGSSTSHLLCLDVTQLQLD